MSECEYLAIIDALISYAQREGILSTESNELLNQLVEISEVPRESLEKLF